MKSLFEFLEEHEGRRHKPYKDTRGFTTIGVGLNLDAGLDDVEINWLLGRRAMRAEKEAINLIGANLWKKLNKPRQYVLISLCFQMGGNGVSKFKNMLAALSIEDYDTAAAEMLDSKWRHQTPRRAFNHAEIMRTGQL